jgi:endo-1,4-beta-xylanase
MQYQNNIRFSCSYRTVSGLAFNRKCSAFFILLVCMIGLLSEYSSAQPLADGKSKYLGCSMRIPIRTNFANYWNQVTPDDAGKWGSVASSSGFYNWTGLDNIYNYSLTHGLPYKHHCLVWGNQQPAYLNSLDSASQREEIRKWIDTVGKRYPNMSFIDVVNEPFQGPPDGRNGRANYINALGGAGSTGWDWVITAFQWARQYCAPGVKLILNEYNVLHDNTITTNYLRLIDTLRVRGLIDAIGIQGHYFEFKGTGYAWSINTIRSNLDRLTATGLPVYITEFDINEADDNTQLQNYQTYFPIFWENAGVKGITLWGYVEDDIWKVDAYLINYRNAERPAMQWLRTYVESPIRPLLISPVAAIDESLIPLLVWHPSESATSYNVQVADNSAFSPIMIDSTVADTLLQLDSLAAHKTFYWKVSASNEKGAGNYSAAASFTTRDKPNGVNNTEGIPTKFVMAQNYPNPFNPSTVICYDIPKIAYVKITIYDVLGRVAATLVDGVQYANKYNIKWSPSNLNTGVYFCRIEALSQDGSDNFTAVRKLLFIK